MPRSSGTSHTGGAQLVHQEQGGLVVVTHHDVGRAGADSAAISRRPLGIHIVGAVHDRFGAAAFGQRREQRVAPNQFGRARRATDIRHAAIAALDDVVDHLAHAVTVVRTQTTRD